MMRITRDQLLAVLAERIKLPRLLALIKHAINTPTVPTNTKRCEYAQHRRDKGVPQGNYIFHYNEADMTLVELTTLDETNPQEDTEMSASNPQNKKHKKIKKTKKDKKIKQVKKDKKSKKDKKKEKSKPSTPANDSPESPVERKPKQLTVETLRAIINTLDQDVYTDDH